MVKNDGDEQIIEMRDAILKAAFNGDPKWLNMAADAANAAHSVMAGRLAELTEALKQARQVLSVYQPDSAPTFYMEAIWNADAALAPPRHD